MMILKEGGVNRSNAGAGAGKVGQEKDGRVQEETEGWKAGD